MTLVREVLATRLRESARHNSGSEVAPAAVIWPDPQSAWLSVVRSILDLAPVLTLGDYSKADVRGPALWIRAVVASPDTAGLPAQFASHGATNPWVIYLPGVRRSELQDFSNMAPALQPLADLVIRATWFEQTPNEPWTPHSFLASKSGGGLSLAGDIATKQAVAGQLNELIASDVEDLQRRGRLDAGKLHGLVVTDHAKTLLRWLNDAEGTSSQLSVAQWTAFASECESSYGFDPTSDTTITAAAHLARRRGGWADVWSRFAEAPALYPGVAAALDQARASATYTDQSCFPSWNLEQENALRDRLKALPGLETVDAAREALIALDVEHSPRTDTVWARLSSAPLAAAVEHLGELAVASGRTAAATTVPEFAKWYAEEGSDIDGLAMSAIEATRSAADRTAVLAALHAVYDPWVDSTARAFQTAATADYPGQVGLDASAGTCVVFVDALRYDLGKRLVRLLQPNEAQITPRVAAFPTVTPTGQPAVAPIKSTWHGGTGFEAGDDQGRAVKGDVFRKALFDAGVQYLDWGSGATGNTTGIAWTQTNAIDSNGHEQGHALASWLDQQLTLVAERVSALLDAGWAKVVVVTDHGFLLPGVAVGKQQTAALDLAVTEGDAARKPRVARLKALANRPPWPIVKWTWDQTVDMVSAPGATTFVGGALYEHGGLSPQECIIPVITLSERTTLFPVATPKIEDIRWVGMRARVDIFPTEASGFVVEIRTKNGDSGSVIGGPKELTEGEARVTVSDPDLEGKKAFVVLLDTNGKVVAQQETTVGGER